MARRRYAKVWWMVRDVSERAKESGVELTEEGARQLLESSEGRLEETMIVAGWTVIEDALSRLAHPQHSQRTASLK